MTGVVLTIGFLIAIPIIIFRELERWFNPPYDPYELKKR